MMATNVYKLTECVSQNTKIIVMFEAYALGLPSPHPCISWKKGPWTATNSNKISRVWSAHTYYMRTHWLTKLSSPSPSSSSVCPSHSSNQCALIPIFNEFLGRKRQTVQPNNSSFPYFTLTTIFHWNRNSMFFPVSDVGCSEMQNKLQRFQSKVVLSEIESQMVWGKCFIKCTKM